MKQRLVKIITQDGNQYGQSSNPQDLMKAQTYLHERISNLAFDFLNNQKLSEVTGFAYELDGGNSFEINIKAPGRIYRTDGLVYDLLSDATLTIQENDNDEPRLDLIVAVLEDDVDADLALIPFVRLRTNDDFSNSVSPYPPLNINAPREKHWRAVVQIKTGTPGLIPSVPTVNSNEIPLYLIAVAGHAAKIRDEDIADLREIILTLRRVNSFVGKNPIDISKLTTRVETVEEIANTPIDLGPVYGSIKTLGDILGSLERRMKALQDLPDVRFVNPKVPLSDKDSAKIPASGAVQTGTPVVDIALGGVINFGDRNVILRPENFEDASRNARFHQVIATPDIVKTETPLLLNGVTQIAADGFTDFVEKSADFDASRARPASAARNSQYIEIFGGLASDNSTALGDWMTYDVDNDTLTPRLPSISLPVAERPAMMTYGDGTNVLLIAGSESDSSPRCFKLNAVTGGVTEITTTKPTGIQFFGDLIAPNKIFIVAIRKESSGFETDFWELNTTTNVFTQVGTTGSVPDLTLDYAHGCFYKQDEFLLVKFTPGLSSSGQTYIFNRASAQWTELNIVAPYGGTAETQLPLSRFRLANVNGRPLLIAGLLTKDTDPTNAKIWEFNSSTSFQADKRTWNSYNATFPPVTDAGFCSTLLSGYASGKAVLFAGQGKFSDSKSNIFASVQGGLIATTYKGQPAITIADNSNFAQFTIPVYNTPWDVAGYVLSIVGDWNESNLFVEVSFDEEDHYYVVTPDKLTLISDSDNPGVRYLRVTMYNLKSSKPILANFIEIFDEDGTALENRMTIRYNAPNSVKALYVDREGKITLSSVIEPSTPDKCLLHKVTPNGSSAPTLKNYINLRRPHIKYEGSGSDAEFDNELAVEARFVNATAVNLLASPAPSMHKIPDPQIEFDGLISIDVTASNDWNWSVEISG